MYARVVRWEDSKAEAVRDTVARIAAQPDPPEGVPAKGIMFLTDPEGGRVTAITLFDSEQDRQQGHEVLESMSPPGEGMGRRVSVEMYEVAIDIRV